MRRASGLTLRILGADDLVAWLEQAPAVAHWFARLIGKLPASGVVSLDEWWENWSTVANPEISPELVTAGRQDQAERIAQWFRGVRSHYYVQGDTQDEAIAFLAACAQIDAALWGSALLTRAVVVENSDAWRSLEGHLSPLVLVRSFSGGNVSPQIAVGRGHHVLTPLGEHRRTQWCRDSHYLGLVGKRLLQELANMGLRRSEGPRACPKHRAAPFDHAPASWLMKQGGPTPGWASSSTPHSLVALVLFGQWNGDHEGDKVSRR